jgi:N-dimethylarginine dimethylaminohydrolase
LTVSDVPTQVPLPGAYARRIADLQEQLRRGEFTLEGMPGYVPGEAPAIETWHNIDYLDIYPKIWGREFGANGIGKLREVALTEITAAEKFPLYNLDPAYFPRMGLDYRELDTIKMRDQSQAYQAALESVGVLVHRVEFPQPPVGAYGPMRSTWAANELLVVRGGSIIEKLAVSPFGFGRCEYLAYWAFTQLGIPPVAAITGKGVAEAGPCFWLAEDVFVAARGIAFNEEGLNQLIPVVQRSSLCDPKDFTALIIDCPGPWYFDPQTGISHHPDMVLGPLSVDTVIAYPAGLDFRTWRFLKERGYKIIEVDRDEQVQWAPANVTIVEPGVVVMVAEAKRTIAAVQKAGIEVLPVEYSEFLRSGGGLHCSTLRLHRDIGPYSTDR